MAITVHSPHSGRPVKIREQDVGRAVRDESGRIFYVLKKQCGSGHYGSRMRGGGAEQERDAARMAEAPAQTVAAAADPPQVHDARGPGRARPRRRLAVLVLILIAVSAAAYVAWRTYGLPVSQPAPRDATSPAGSMRDSSALEPEEAAAEGEGTESGEERFLERKDP